MERKDKIEVFVGGIFGVIAIAAAIVEYLNADLSALAGCLKDIFGTLVVVVILIASIRLPSFKLETKLRNRVENWGLDNAPLIFKATNYGATDGTSQGFKIVQNQKQYTDLILTSLNKDDEEWKSNADYNNHKTGKFLAMPAYDEMLKDDFKITVYTNQSHFQKLPDFEKNFVNMINACNSRFDKIALRKGNQYIFDLSFNKVSTSEDIEYLVGVLDFVLSVVKIIM